MSATPRKELAPAPLSTPPSSMPRSGVIPRVPSSAEVPPWTVVHAYLTHGEHAAWVEAHAAQSRAFADVLAALRHDIEERKERARGRVRLRRG